MQRRIRQPWIVVIIVLIMAAASVFADVPQNMAIQGKLTDLDGNPVPAGLKIFRFAIFDAEVGGTKIWPPVPSEDQTIWTNEAGVWNATLGVFFPIDEPVFPSNSDRWLEVTVDDGVNPAETLSRVLIGSNAYAFRSERAEVADDAERLGGLTASAFSPLSHGHAPGEISPQGAGSGLDADLLDGNQASAFAPSGHTHPSEGWTDDGTTVRLTDIGDSVGIGTASPGAKLDVDGDANIRGKATVGSGHTNTGAYAFVAGRGNDATGDYSVVAGGGGPNAADSNVASGLQSTVGGGLSNEATNWAATVAGGWDNEVGGAKSFIGGGTSNRVSGDDAVVAGGQQNHANSALSFIGGGIFNTTEGAYATILGGSDNKSTNQRSTVGGGSKNVASGSYSTVSGGALDSATGTYSSVPGGYANVAGGRYSFAAGRRAKARHTGSFVWADSTNADFGTSGPNQFLVRASGGTQIDGPTGNSGVVLPEGVISDFEIYDEPGIAAGVGSGIHALTTTTSDIETVTITAPATGYIVVEARLYVIFSGTTGANEAIVQIDQTAGGSAVTPHFTRVGLAGYPSTGSNRFSVYSSRVYSVGSGTFTFRLEGYQVSGSTGTASTYHPLVTATYYPGSYGTVGAVVSSTEAGEFEEAIPVRVDTDLPSGSHSAETMYRVDLRELETKLDRARAETERLERELAEARAEEQQEIRTQMTNDSK